MSHDSRSEQSLSAGGWQLENTYAALPEPFFQHVKPAPVRAPQVVILNHRLADQLGLALGDVPEQLCAAWFAGLTLPPGAVPIAQAYAGHQFGSFTMLGDGRAILLGEQRTPSGDLIDIQLKGAGRTAFSRGGDGRAALGPMLREYVISEAMQGLGIPTTQSLAVVVTGEPVYRETMLSGAILTRVAASHLRVGTFQYLAARRDPEHLRVLADYAIDRHFPQLAATPDKYLQLLREVITLQADLVAQWQLVGFVHGVMNTDNMAICGQTIDYGPCAFLDTFHPETVFSSIDYGGRYAYGNQPNIAHWNLVRFAETLIPLLDPDSQRAVEIAMAALDEYPATFNRRWLNGMRRKLGWQTETADDQRLIDNLLLWMETHQADFTNTFDDLSTGAVAGSATDWDAPETGRSVPSPHATGQACSANANADPYADPEFRAWLSAWEQRVAVEGESVEAARGRMRRANPAIIPRNHRVEEALAAATQHDDLSVLHRLLKALADPYNRDELRSAFRDPPPSDSPRYRTFCGT